MGRNARILREGIVMKQDKTPWSLLPTKEPKTEDPKLGYFYDNVARHLVKDTVRVMQNGLPIDLTKVQELEHTLDETINNVHKTLATNPIVTKYMEQKHKNAAIAYREERMSKCKSSEQYLKPFKHNDMNHRSYFMYLYGQDVGLTQPEELLPTGIPKWPANAIKKIKGKPILVRLLKGEVSDTSNKYAKGAVELFAQHKADIYNKKFIHQANTLEGMDVPKFNPGSPDQKHDILTDILGYESEKMTDAYVEYERNCNIAHKRGLPEPPAPKNKFSWNRENVKRISDITQNEDEKALLLALIDFSMGSIIKNNFIQSFYKYTVDGRLYGQYKLLGAKSGRYTSSNPNMLNAPSTGSIYAKPVKKCFTAPPGYKVWTIDYASLEDRVLASLTLDPGKLAVYKEELDGHCYNAVQYYPKEIAKHMEVTGDPVADAKAMDIARHDNDELDALRQKSKPVTFKCAYLGMPDAHKGGVITQEIYDNYHQRAYPNIMKQVNDYILPRVKAKGNIHLGMGFYINSDKPDKDVRTLNNALNQFWSILTALAISELHARLDAQLVNPNDIQVTSTIYDSIYGIVKDDSELIQWLNDNIVEIMIKDFIEGQVIHNEAKLEVGTNWANMTELENNCSIEEIETTLRKYDE